MEPFSPLLFLCVVNSAVTGDIKSSRTKYAFFYTSRMLSFSFQPLTTSSLAYNIRAAIPRMACTSSPRTQRNSTKLTQGVYTSRPHSRRHKSNLKGMVNQKSTLFSSIPWMWDVVNARYSGGMNIQSAADRCQIPAPARPTRSEKHVV